METFITQAVYTDVTEIHHHLFNQSFLIKKYKPQLLYKFKIFLFALRFTSAWALLTNRAQ